MRTRFAEVNRPKSFLEIDIGGYSLGGSERLALYMSLENKMERTHKPDPRDESQKMRIEDDAIELETSCINFP